MKKQATKYVSYYQYDCDEPVIIVCDQKKDAMKDAVETLDETLADCRFSDDKHEKLAELKGKGITSLDEGAVTIGVFRCEYRLAGSIP